MEPLAVVGGLDERPDGGAGMGEIAIGAGVDFLAFERLHEALGHGVVVGTAGPAHAGLDTGGLKAGDVVTASVLNAAVGMVDQATGDHLPAGQRHLKRIQGQARPQVISHCPPDDLAAEGVQHDGQVDEGLS